MTTHVFPALTLSQQAAPNAIICKKIAFCKFPLDNVFVLKVLMRKLIMVLKILVKNVITHVKLVLRAPLMIV